MKQRHACFISFPLDVPDAEQLAEDLYEALRARLTLYDKQISVFFCPRADRERYGTDWENWIVPALCHSAMMIAICPPSYFSSSPGCTREFLAMEKLLEQRRPHMTGQVPDTPFIVGLQLIQNYSIPELNPHKVEDFSFYPMETTRLARKKTSRRKVATIADYVWKAWCEYSKPAHQEALDRARLCAQFALEPLPARYLQTSDRFPTFGGVSGA